MTRSTVQFVLVGAVVAVTAGPASAWSTAQQANPPHTEGRSPAVAMNRAGVAATAWVQGPWRSRAIVVQVRSAGGRWERAVRVSRRGRPAIDPRVQVDASGRVVVVWRQAAGSQRVVVSGRTTRITRWVVRARIRGADGIWGAVTTLSPNRRKVGAPDLAVDGAGNAVAVWHWGTGTSPRQEGFVGQVQASVLVGGTWSRRQRLSGAAGCTEERRPRVAMGSRGHTVVWWQCDVRGGSTALAVTRGPDDTEWSARSELPFRTSGDQRADLGVAADGAVTAVSAARGGAVRWWRGAVGPTRLGLRELPQLAAEERADDDAEGPRVDVEPSGDALTAWVAAGGRGAVRAAPVASALGAGAPTTLLGGRPARGVDVAAGADRRGAAAWVEWAGTRRAAVMGAVRDETGSWAAPRRISTAGGIVLAGSPRLAGRGGRAVAVWERVTADGRRVVERAEFPES